MRLNSRLKGCISRQHLWTVTYGNGHTATLPLEVFTQRNFVADFILLKLNFIKKNEKMLFELPFGGLSGNVHTPSIARFYS